MIHLRLLKPPRLFRSETLQDTKVSIYIYIYLVYIYLYIKFKNSDTHARRFEDAHETETLPTLKLIPFWRRVGGMITKSFDVELDCLWKTSAFETFAGLSHFETSAFTFGVCHLFLPPFCPGVGRLETLLRGWVGDKNSRDAQ